MAEISPAGRRDARAFLTLFALYLATWIVSNWPGLATPWWQMDDYAAPVGLAACMQRSFENGRLIEGLWLWSLSLDGTPLEPHGNVALRVVQGALHALLAALLARSLSPPLRLPAAALAVAPFLLWPFGAEVTLWRTGGSVVLAALLAAFAVRMVEGDRSGRWPHRFLAASLAGLAVLTHHVGACMGFVFLALLTLRDLQPDARLDARKRLRTTITYTIGFAAGGLLSVVVVHTLGSWGAARGALATDPIAKLDFLLDLHRTMLVSRLYPQSLRWLGGGLFVLALGAGLWSLLRTARSPALARLACFGAALVAPYVAVLAVAESWPAWRVLYPGATVFIAAFLLARASAPAWTRVPLLALMAAITVHDAVLSWRNAAEYVSLFRADRALAAHIEAQARAEGLVALCVVTHPTVTVSEWNPRHLQYALGDSKLPALLQWWSAEAMLRAFVPLPIRRDEATLRACRELFESRRRPGEFFVERLPGTTVLCIGPP